MGRLIHRSAGKGDSRKFAVTGFCELRLETEFWEVHGGHHHDNQVTQPIDYRVAKPLARVILLEVRAKENDMLSPEEHLRLLSMVDILEPLSQDEIRELSRRVPDTHYQQGQLLYTP